MHRALWLSEDDRLAFRLLVLACLLGIRVRRIPMSFFAAKFLAASNVAWLVRTRMVASMVLAAGILPLKDDEAVIR